MTINKQKKIELSGINSDYKEKRKEKEPISHITDNDLVQGCVNGDREAQRLLFRHYRQTVYAMVYKMLGPGYEIDDIAQKAFIRIYTSFKHFKGLSSLDTWIYRITSKTCTDELRKKYRKRQIHINQFDDEKDSDSYIDHRQKKADKIIEQKELRKRIYNALHALNKDKRTVIVLFDIEGLSLEDISHIVQKPIGTVKSRLFHARKEMHKLLGPYLEIKDEQ